jgi:hypothetical protein
MMIEHGANRVASWQRLLEVRVPLLVCQIPPRFQGFVDIDPNSSTSSALSATLNAY